MASQVLSGTSNPSYTNNTGQNVRVVINFMRATNPFREPGLTYFQSGYINIKWAGVSTGQIPLAAIGRNLAFADFQETSAGGPTNSYGSVGLENFNRVITSNNASMTFPDGSFFGDATGGGALPTEIILAPGQTFSATCGIYNIVVIPEAG